MKKKLFIIIILITTIIALNLLQYNELLLFASSANYAQITNNTTYFYKTSNTIESIDNKWCLLPKTFFVKILTTFNDTYYKAQYYDIIGYVKKNEVSLVKETPQKPYPTIKNITTKSSTSCYMRTTPQIRTSINNIIKTLPSSTTNIEFLGKIIGEEAIDTQGTIWYLVKHNNDIGYIYTYFSNTIIVDEVNVEKVSLIKDNLSPVITPLSDPENVLLITIILTPLLLIMYLLYKPHKTKQITNKNKYKNYSNKTQNEDYFNDPEL